MKIMTQLHDPTRHDALTLLMLYSELINEGERLRQRREFAIQHLRDSGCKKSQTKKSLKSQIVKSSLQKSSKKRAKKSEERSDLLQLPAEVTSDVKMLISSSRDILDAVRGAARLVRGFVSRRDGVRAASSVWPMFRWKTTWSKFQFHFMKSFKER